MVVGAVLSMAHTHNSADRVHCTPRVARSMDGSTPSGAILTSGYAHYTLEAISYISQPFHVRCHQKGEKRFVNCREGVFNV